MAREGRTGDGCSNHADFTACFMARIAHTQQEIARKQRPPGIGCLEHSQPTTRELSCTHTTNTTNNHTTTTTPASTQPHISAPSGSTSCSTPASASALPKPTPPKSPQAPKQEDFAEQPYRGVIHMIIGGSSVDFEMKRQKRDHYRSINHVALTGPLVQTRWSHVPLTFNARDVDLRSAPHVDAMVINCSVAG
jgi:hypothetical protein